MCPLHIITPYSIQINFNIIFQFILMSSKVSPPQFFSIKMSNMINQIIYKTVLWIFDVKVLYFCYYRSVKHQR
jgi:hypothetical protein